MTTREDTKLDAPPGRSAVDNEARTPGNNFDQNFNYTREPTGLTVVHREDDEEDTLNNNDNATEERLERNRSDVSEAKGEHDARTPEEAREVDDIRRRLATVDLRDADDGEDADEDDLQDTTKVEYNPSGEPKGTSILPSCVNDSSLVLNSCYYTPVYFVTVVYRCVPVSSHRIYIHCLLLKKTCVQLRSSSYVLN